jgi:hypothetical protein
MPRPESIESGRPVTRRRFLQLTLAALSASVLAGTGIAAFDWFGLRTRAKWQWRFGGNPLTAYRYAFMPADQRIRAHFADLTIDEAGLQRFVRDFEKHVGPVRLYSVTSNGLLFSKFLLSSDHYHNGADPMKPVHYVAFYDPYVSPCYDPFHRV